jgi:SAM-dependent methyltransferase
VFDHYTDIFNQRGASYHRAMTEVPTARREEFIHALSMLNLHRGMRMVDAPSGGGYLQEYLNGLDVDLLCVETASAFVREAEGDLRHEAVLCERLDRIPIENESVDCVLSLAGVHHLESKVDFYRETARILRNNGLFCLADVTKGSAVDRFLNGFVDQYCSLGHRGVFLDFDTLEELDASGFCVLSEKHAQYFWYFRDRYEMARYCQLLFGLDRADADTVLEGIGSILGFEETASACRMNWGLWYIQARRTS